MEMWAVTRIRSSSNTSRGAGQWVVVVLLLELLLELAPGRRCTVEPMLHRTMIRAMMRFPCGTDPLRLMISRGASTMR